MTPFYNLTTSKWLSPALAQHNTMATITSFPSDLTILPTKNTFLPQDSGEIPLLVESNYSVWSNLMKMQLDSIITPDSDVIIVEKNITDLLYTEYSIIQCLKNSFFKFGK
jgi:hypothetical protein